MQKDDNLFSGFKLPETVDKYEQAIRDFCDPFKKDKRSAIRKIMKLSF